MYILFFHLDIVSVKMGKLIFVVSDKNLIIKNNNLKTLNTQTY